jgi:hypothetical protein
MLTRVEGHQSLGGVGGELEFHLGARHDHAEHAQVRVHGDRRIAPFGHQRGATISPSGEILRSHPLYEEVGEMALEQALQADVPLPNAGLALGVTGPDLSL